MILGHLSNFLRPGETVALTCADARDLNGFNFSYLDAADVCRTEAVWLENVTYPQNTEQPTFEQRLLVYCVQDVCATDSEDRKEVARSYGDRDPSFPPNKPNLCNGPLLCNLICTAGLIQDWTECMDVCTGHRSMLIHATGHYCEAGLCPSLLQETEIMGLLQHRLKQNSSLEITDEDTESRRSRRSRRSWSSRRSSSSRRSRRSRRSSSSRRSVSSRSRRSRRSSSSRRSTSRRVVIGVRRRKVFKDDDIWVRRRIVKDDDKDSRRRIVKDDDIWVRRRIVKDDDKDSRRRIFKDDDIWVRRRIVKDDDKDSRRRIVKDDDKDSRRRIVKDDDDGSRRRIVKDDDKDSRRRIVKDDDKDSRRRKGDDDDGSRRRIVKDDDKDSRRRKKDDDSDDSDDDDDKSKCVDEDSLCKKICYGFNLEGKELYWCLHRCHAKFDMQLKPGMDGYCMECGKYWGHPEVTTSTTTTTTRPPSTEICPFTTTTTTTTHPVYGDDDDDDGSRRRIVKDGWRFFFGYFFGFRFSGM